MKTFKQFLKVQSGKRRHSNADPSATINVANNKIDTKDIVVGDQIDLGSTSARSSDGSRIETPSLVPTLI